MSRRTTLAALLLTLIVLVAPPAAAKGPTEVKVHDPGTGETTLLDFPDRGEMGALQLLVGWPRAKKEPRAAGELVHVATLTWQHWDGMVAWVDRIYSDGTGTGWVKRRDYLSGSGTVSWGRTSAYAIKAVLSEIQSPEKGSTATMVERAGGIDPCRGASTLTRAGRRVLWDGSRP
ncbi:hypothetical protein [Nocardioides sp.]|uniref:hypothetical protein n=1 Tax=Nocardioides sp. TaxID=35761 RepID=UPI002B61242A|nr:hypothetical protein [Nocardioides sp.]HXH81205.1 hypothetical protein [Nocardioides sp.]